MNFIQLPAIRVQHAYQRNYGVDILLIVKNGEEHFIQLIIWRTVFQQTSSSLNGFIDTIL